MQTIGARVKAAREKRGMKQAELEKWRVFIPYRAPIARERHPRVYKHFQDLFGEDVDPH